MMRTNRLDKPRVGRRNPHSDVESRTDDVAPAPSASAATLPSQSAVLSCPSTPIRQDGKVCVLCGESFPNGSALRRHHRMNPNCKPFRENVLDVSRVVDAVVESQCDAPSSENSEDDSDDDVDIRVNASGVPHSSRSESRASQRGGRPPDRRENAIDCPFHAHGKVGRTHNCVPSRTALTARKAVPHYEC